VTAQSDKKGLGPTHFLLRLRSFSQVAFGDKVASLTWKPSNKGVSYLLPHINGVYYVTMLEDVWREHGDSAQPFQVPFAAET